MDTEKEEAKAHKNVTTSTTYLYHGQQTTQDPTTPVCAVFHSVIYRHFPRVQAAEDHSHEGAPPQASQQNTKTQESDPVPPTP